MECEHGDTAGGVEWIVEWIVECLPSPHRVADVEQVLRGTHSATKHNWLLSTLRRYKVVPTWIWGKQVRQKVVVAWTISKRQATAQLFCKTDSNKFHQPSLTLKTLPHNCTCARPLHPDTLHQETVHSREQTIPTTRL